MLFSSKKFEKQKEALETVRQALRREGVLHPLRKEQLKHALMQKIEGNFSSETNSAPQRYIWRERRVSMIKYIASTLIGITAVGGTAFASTGSKPGDTFFPLKKAVEQVRLHLATNDQSQADMHLKIAEDRLNDMDKVETDNKDEAQAEATTEVKGALEALTTVHTKLEAKGNATAAAAVQTNIDRLKAHAEEHSLKVESKTETDADVEEGSSQTNQNSVNGSVKSENGIQEHANDNARLKANLGTGADINVGGHETENEGE